jgi:triphosphatase
MVTEIELKYSLLDSHELDTSEQIMTKVSQLLSENELTFIHHEKQLSNHYFDTPDLALRKSKVALRTRGTKCFGEACHFEQTVKTSGTIIAGLHQRPEYNVDIDNEKPIIALFPHTIWQSKTNIIQLQQQIVELFSTHFTRHTWLVNVDDTQVEIAFDCGEIACQNYLNKPRIYEIELELVKGDTQALFVLTKLLFSQLSLRPGQLTKAARGYALYHESKTSNSDVNVKVANGGGGVEQISLSMIDIPKNSQLDNAFTCGIESSLTQLQLTVDSYVEASSVERLNKLNKISELLVLLRHGFWIFNEILTPDEVVLRAELSYFIRTISWVDNARYIQSLTSKQSTYQKESSVNQELITKLQLTKARYPRESQVLALLHSERFNNLQVNLLSLLLRRHSDNTSTVCNYVSLIDFATAQLNTSTKALSYELEQLTETQSSLSIERYLTAHSLLIRALATTSWFSCLFSEPQSALIKRYNMPWLDIKQGISELQSLSLLQQQLVHLPNPEKKLALWLTNKSENLIMALDQSRSKALTMKPYWP